jgi:hypothetical protein
VATVVFGFVEKPKGSPGMFGYYGLFSLAGCCFIAVVQMRRRSVLQVHTFGTDSGLLLS